MKESIQYAAAPVAFKFALSQLVNIRISEEFGEVQARAQYATSENQYLIHYQAADKCARSRWFGESELEPVQSDEHPGAPVFAGINLPEGAEVTE
ncbi:TPA: hypothetical protein SLP51_000011 [Klebsiella aerogenes]|nr:hypothetical protein [Klebsiella aerogenes]